MKTPLLRLLLVVSLLLNAGVIGAVAWRAWDAGAWPAPFAQGGRFPGLPRYLELSEVQRGRWRETERRFLEQLAADTAEIRVRRERMIHEIFLSAAPDAAAIEAERAGIARLQDRQQRRVIEQLIAERGMLDAGQRERLARLLLSEPVGPGAFERLHRD